MYSFGLVLGCIIDVVAVVVAGRGGGGGKGGDLEEVVRALAEGLGLVLDGICIDFPLLRVLAGILMMLQLIMNNEQTKSEK